MPIPNSTIRIDPRDLTKNKAIGISIPFNASNVFNSTFSTKDQIKSNLINLLLTNKGERVYEPNFGCDLYKMLFEPSTDQLYERIRSNINYGVNTYIPEISVVDIDITSENNYVYIILIYRLNLSGTEETITIEIK